MSHPRRKPRPERPRPSLALLVLSLLLAAGTGAAAPADHLIISEVVTIDVDAPPRPRSSSFIEIVNPTAGAVDLSDVYLTDATFVTNGVGYWRIAEAAASANTAGGGTAGDFHCRFPSGYVMAAGDTIVISVSGSGDYFTAYGRLPDFELFEDATTPDQVPEMVEALPGAIAAGSLVGGSNLPDLTDNAESLMLYTWDGTGDLVGDLDYLRWGVTSITNITVDKTGVTVGGGTYQPDTAAANQATVSPSALTFGQAYARLDSDEGTETAAAGNGVGGHDETSEDFTATWQTAGQEPPLAPGVAFPAAPIFTAGSQTPDMPVDGQAVDLSVDVVSPSALGGVDFVYTVDGGAPTTVAGVPGAGDTFAVSIPGAAEGTVVAWYATATNAGGGTARYPGSAPVFTNGWTVIAEPPPNITEADFTPTAPYDGQEATLSVTADSISPLSGATFYVSYDAGAFGAIAGTDQGGVYTATVPAQAEGVVVAWYVVVSNQAGLDATHPAGAPGVTEGWTVDAAPDPDEFPAKLLITEIAIQFTAQEFIEIHNPGTQAVDMSDYYLTDAIFSTGGQYYWHIAQGNPAQNTVGGGAFADFHARFPDGFTIAAGDTIVVSVAGSSSFIGEYEFLPDLELFEDDAFPDAVPDMRWVFGDETNNSIITRTGGDPSSPTLSNGAETVILYNWHEGEDKVVDIDVFFWKDPSSTTTSHLFSKTGVTIGSHSYLPDTDVTLQTPFAVTAPGGQSYQRVDVTEGNQIPTGSNGVLGRDETSEDFNSTFAILDADPSRPGGAVDVGGGEIALEVEAKTFLPRLGEIFPIRFTSKPRSETRLRLYDLEGRLVLTLFDSRFNGPPSVIPGSYTTVPWNGLDDTFQFVKGGMYIIHLSVVDSDSGEEETKTAPVVVATRLSN